VNNEKTLDREARAEARARWTPRRMLSFALIASGVFWLVLGLALRLLMTRG
jgi:hypothetical protein